VHNDKIVDYNSEKIKNNSESNKNLKMFSSKFNTMSGKLEWDILDENYDYYQELARAGFADMLHDMDRVKK
jgi:hypothetical protein